MDESSFRHDLGPSRCWRHPSRAPRAESVLRSYKVKESKVEQYEDDKEEDKEQKHREGDDNKNTTSVKYGVTPMLKRFGDMILFSSP